jgi:hypothetical protein
MLPHLTGACMPKTKTTPKYVSPLNKGVYAENYDFWQGRVWRKLWLLRSMLPHLTRACMPKTMTSPKYVTPLDKGVYAENYDLSEVCYPTWQGCKCRKLSRTYVVLHFRHVSLTMNNILRSLWSSFVAPVQFYFNRSTALEHLHKVVTMYFNTFSSMQSSNTTLLSLFMLTGQQTIASPPPYSSSIIVSVLYVSTNKKSPISVFFGITDLLDFANRLILEITYFGKCIYFHKQAPV